MSYYIDRRGLIPKILSTVIITGISGLIAFLIVFIAFFYGLLNHYVFLSIFGLLLLTATLLFFIWNRSFVYKYLRFFLLGGILFLLIALGYVIADLSVNQFPAIRENPGDHSMQIHEVSEQTTFEYSFSDPLPKGISHPYFSPLSLALTDVTNSKELFLIRDPSDTSSLYQSLIQGEVDFIISNAPLESEKQLAAEKGLTFILTPIAKDGIVFFVHNTNPLNNLTFEDLREIYGGKMTEWKSLNKKTGPIIAFQRPENSLSQNALVKIMNGRPLMQPPIANILEGPHGSMQQVADYKNDPNALGFSSRFYSLPMFRKNEIKFLRINNIYPDETTIQSEKYPFTETIFFVTTEKSYENPNIAILSQWLTSDNGQKFIRQIGYIPQR